MGNLTLLALPIATFLAQEAGHDFLPYAKSAVAVPTEQATQLERVTTAVPWPRGLVSTKDGLVALARGRHRNAGGIDPTVNDAAGTLFKVDPDCFEPVIRSEAAGQKVRRNAEVFVAAQGSPFKLYDAEQGAPIDANEIDRPYCTLAYDPVSSNYFICGYSGVDLPAKRFRKNATDSILRYDTRDEAWHVVEQHDPSVVPTSELSRIVPNQYYPHHDSATSQAPHGYLNGPDGALVVGDYLYAVGKDNHILVRYDLREVRRDPSAGAPESQVVFQREVNMLLDGKLQRVEVLGASALEAKDGFLYVGFRTSSIILRLPIDESGAVLEDAVAELIAVFEPWSDATGRSANLIDMAFGPDDELYVACAENGRIWNIGQPDPAQVFNGVDVGENPTTHVPYVDLPKITSNPRARCGNITFDEKGRLYLCSGNYDSGTKIAGVIYRVVGE